MSDRNTAKETASTADVAGSAANVPGGGVMSSPFFRLLAINWLIGAFAAVLVLCGLLWLDTGGLRSLILNSPEPWLPILVLLFGLMVTLCSAAMGAAVMALPSSDDEDRGKGQRLRAAPHALFGGEPVPAVARAGGRRLHQD